ncbi:hypothetical protein T484DRAFT_2025341 [Baffinella frigidus]|nr:hypothetical protein T484DRAFT_2025341 [Cryptophyta sp. CCMP2293]
MRNGRVSRNSSATAASSERAALFEEGLLHYMSEQEALFPIQLVSRRLRTGATREAILGPASRLPSDELFGRTTSSPNQTLRFPVQCLAHPDNKCECIKTRSMAQSQAFPWCELASRFNIVQRTILAPLERTVIARRKKSLAAPATLAGAAGAPRRSSVQTAPAALAGTHQRAPRRTPLARESSGVARVPREERRLAGASGLSPAQR